MYTLIFFLLFASCNAQHDEKSLFLFFFRLLLLNPLDYCSAYRKRLLFNIIDTVMEVGQKAGQASLPEGAQFPDVVPHASGKKESSAASTFTLQ